jgi:integrase
VPRRRTRPSARSSFCTVKFLTGRWAGLRRWSGLDRPQRLPVVLSRPEVRALLGALDGTHWLMASLLYGAGLRLLECLRLRVMDLDFAKHQLVVRAGKGD